ncbi:MAG: HU family DNA-binding protein [Gammaproteobacteria bacterium]
MNKSELVDAIASEAGITKAAAAKNLDAMITIIKKALKKGESVVIPGFGSFMVSERKERTGRNPQTGAVIKIKAQNSPKFKPGKGLKDAVAK